MAQKLSASAGGCLPQKAEVCTEGLPARIPRVAAPTCPGAAFKQHRSAGSQLHGHPSWGKPSPQHLGGSPSFFSGRLVLHGMGCSQSGVGLRAACPKGATPLSASPFFWHSQGMFLPFSRFPLRLPQAPVPSLMSCCQEGKHGRSFN